VVPRAIRRARGGIGSWTSRAWPRAIVAEIVRDLLSSPCSCSCSCSWTRSGTFASACDACDASDAFGLSCPSCPACPSSPSCCGCDCGSRTGIANLSERRIGAFGPSCPSCAASPSSPSCCGCGCGSRNGIASLSGRRIGSDPSPSLGLEGSAPHLSAELCALWIRFSLRELDSLSQNWRAQQPEPWRHASEAISGRRTEEIRALAFVRARIRIADPHEERGLGQSKRGGL